MIAERMSKRVLLGALAVVALGGVGYWIHRASKVVEPDSAASPPPRRLTDEEALRLREEAKKRADEVGRGLLRSFDTRVYDPARDDHLDHVEGTATATSDGKKARYRFTFDAAKPAAEMLDFAPLEEQAGLPKDTARDVRHFVAFSLLGAAQAVAAYRPPIPLELTPSADRKNTVVTARPYHNSINVSYSFDSRQLVAMRGEWDDRERWVTTYQWRDLGGRFVVDRATTVTGAGREKIHDGPATEFAYATRDGVRLLDAVRVRGPDHSLDVVFVYDSVRKRAP